MRLFSLFFSVLRPCQSTPLLLFFHSLLRRDRFWCLFCFSLCLRIDTVRVVSPLPLVENDVRWILSKARCRINVIEPWNKPVRVCLFQSIESQWPRLSLSVQSRIRIVEVACLSLSIILDDAFAVYCLSGTNRRSMGLRSARLFLARALPSLCWLWSIVDREMFYSRWQVLLSTRFLPVRHS